MKINVFTNSAVRNSTSIHLSLSSGFHTPPSLPLLLPNPLSLYPFRSTWSFEVASLHIPFYAVFAFLSAVLNLDPHACFVSCPFIGLSLSSRPLPSPFSSLLPPPTPLLWISLSALMESSRLATSKAFRLGAKSHEGERFSLVKYPPSPFPPPPALPHPLPTPASFTVDGEE